MSNLLNAFRQWFLNWIATPVDPEPIPAPTPPAPVPSTSQALVVTAINAARAAAGISPLVADPTLGRLSSTYAASMASLGVLSHGDFADRIASVYPNTAAGEDIAEGQPDAASVVTAWMGDPPHRANILGDFNRIGVGIAPGDSGTIYWCVDFVLIA